MKKYLFFIFLIAMFVFGCSSQPKTKPPEFPLANGTTWVYSYETYEPSASDSTRIIKASYQLTETVVDVKNVSTYLTAHVKRENKLINAEAGWTGDLSSQPNEFWYVVNGQQVLQSNQPLDDANIKINELILDYEFPLSVNKKWCLLLYDPKDPNKVIGCDTVGRREVISQGSYKTSTGSFDDCYDMIDYSNGGNLFQKFCVGVGMVSMKYDHAGTRFGFEQTLIDYSAGDH